MDIRNATGEDLETLSRLLLDMEVHYEGDAAIDLDTARERAAVALGADHSALILLALDPEAVGFVSIYPTFPGKDLKMAWYLKELYVASWARGRGTGEKLMRRAAEEVIARGGERIDFTTDIQNDGAQKLYDRLGATRVSKVFYRFSGEGLKELAGDDTD